MTSIRSCRRLSSALTLTLTRTRVSLVSCCVVSACAGLDVCTTYDNFLSHVPRLVVFVIRQKASALLGEREI